MSEKEDTVLLCKVDMSDLKGKGFELAILPEKEGKNR